MNKQELADKIRSLRNSDSLPMNYVNPDDKLFWRNTYLVYIETGMYWLKPFLVHANNEQEAFDEIVDYAEEKGFVGYFAEDSHLEELRQDAIASGHDEDAFIDEQFTQGGNHGRYFANMARCFEVLNTDKRS